MKKIAKLCNCCGCGACASICPKQCIKMVADSEGFLYPQVDAATCVDCGQCEQVCNELHPYAERTPLKVLAAINKDENVRQKSSSGGYLPYPGRKNHKRRRCGIRCTLR